MKKTLRVFLGFAPVACRCDNGGARVGWQSIVLYLYDGQAYTNRTRLNDKRKKTLRVFYRLVHLMGVWGVVLISLHKANKRKTNV